MYDNGEEKGNCVRSLVARLPSERVHLKPVRQLYELEALLYKGPWNKECRPLLAAALQNLFVPR